MEGKLGQSFGDLEMKLGFDNSWVLMPMKITRPLSHELLEEKFNK